MSVYPRIGILLFSELRWEESIDAYFHLGKNSRFCGSLIVEFKINQPRVLERDYFYEISIIILRKTH